MPVRSRAIARGARDRDSLSRVISLFSSRDSPSSLYRRDYIFLSYSYPAHPLLTYSHHGNSPQATASRPPGQSVPAADHGHLRVDGTSRGLSRGPDSLRSSARRAHDTDTNPGTVTSTRSHDGSLDSPRRSASDPISPRQGGRTHEREPPANSQLPPTRTTPQRQSEAAGGPAQG